MSATYPEEHTMATTARPTDYSVKNIWENCGKCGGSGSVSWGTHVSGAVLQADGTQVQVPQVCFTCGGTGGKYVSQQQLDRREKSRARRQARKADEYVKKAASHRVRVANARERWNADPANVELAAALPTLGEFGKSLIAALDSFGCLTDRQADAARRALAAKAQQAPAALVVAGKATVTGKILSAKEHFSPYGVSLKMVVKDDRGFRVWGSVPRALLSGQNDLEELPGHRVQFQATLVPSEDDPEFGFFKRPTKAQLI